MDCNPRQGHRAHRRHQAHPGAHARRSGRLRQIIMISSAMHQFTHEGHIVLIASTTGAMLRAAYRGTDTGIGSRLSASSACSNRFRISTPRPRATTAGRDSSGLSSALGQLLGLRARRTQWSRAWARRFGSSTTPGRPAEQPAFSPLGPADDTGVAMTPRAASLASTQLIFSFGRPTVAGVDEALTVFDGGCTVSWCSPTN